MATGTSRLVAGSLLLASLSLGCASRPGSSQDPTALAQVRYRPAAPDGPHGKRLVDALPGAAWDAGLALAAQELALAASSPRARITPAAGSLAAARAGFPGDARFGRLLNGGAFPEPLVEEAMRAFPGEAALDVGLASRRYGDGDVLWILGLAPRRGNLDPLARDMTLDSAAQVRVDPDVGGDLHLFVAPPGDLVKEYAITGGVARWLDIFHVPGEYRLEVVASADSRGGQVLQRFSLFVDSPPPPVGSLPSALPAPDPEAAEEWLRRELDRRRQDLGLAPLERFPLFEPLAREHSAYMAETGVLDHVIPGVTAGVAARAKESFHPRASHHQNVAAAFTAEEALEAVWLSPGHRRNLLCETCTHLSLGVALEPVLDAVPRLFVTWEILTFPHGPPAPIQKPR